MQQLHAVALGSLTPPVIPSSRIRVGVPHQRLDRRQVDAGIKQVAGERAAEIVG
jgi:hypothetical protein